MRYARHIFRITLALAAIAACAHGYDSLNVYTKVLWPYGLINDMEPYTTDDGKNLAIASGSGLVLVNVSDTGRTRVMSMTPTNAVIKDVKIVGKYAYIANGEEGFKIYDISDAERIRCIGKAATRGYAHYLEIRDDIAYVAEGDSGISVFSIGKKTNPKKISWIQTKTPARYLKVSGKRLYAALVDTDIHFIVSFTDDVGGIAEYAIDDPKYPVFIKFSEKNIRDYYCKFSCYDNKLAVLSDWGLKVYDLISGNWSDVRSVYEPEYTLFGCEGFTLSHDGYGLITKDGGDLWRMQVRDTLLYLIDSVCTNRRSVIALFDGRYFIAGERFITYNPGKKGIREDDLGFPANYQRINLYEDDLWVATEKSIRVIDVGGGECPKSIARCDIVTKEATYSPLDFTIDNTSAYISTWQRENKVQRIRANDHNFLKSEIQGTAGWSFSFVRDSLVVAYDNDGWLRLCTLDTSLTLTQHSKIGRRQSTNPELLQGNILYVSANAGKEYGFESADSLVVYDIGNISKPVQLGSWRKVDTTIIAHVIDSTLWTKGFIERVADTVEAKAIIAKAPYGTIEYEESNTHIIQVIVRDTLAFVTTNKTWAEYRYPDKLYILNISHLDSIRLLCEMPMESPDVTIETDEQYLYVCDISSGMRVYDIASLPGKREIGHYLKPQMELIGKTGNAVCVKLTYGGFQLFTVSRDNK